MTPPWNDALATLRFARIGAALLASLLSSCGGPAITPSSGTPDGASSPTPPGTASSQAPPLSTAPATSRPPSAASPSGALLRERDSAPAVSEGLDGVYLETHEIIVFDGEHWQPQEVDDCLRIRRLGANQLELEVQLIATNAHLCGIEGVASRLPGTEEVYELRPEPAEEPCRLQLVVETERLELVDVEHQCRQTYCGARAGFDGVRFARAGRRPARRRCVD